MGDDVTESLYDRVADLPVVIEAATLQGRSVETSYGFTRPTTVVSLSGAGETGVGEDVTTDPADHDRFQREGIGADLTGRYTFDEFSGRITALDIVDSEADWNEPGRARRWALESAALDLGLRQADTSLGAVLNRSYDPVRFVVSLRLADPVSLAPVEGWRDVHPDLSFKLDVVPDWDDDFVAKLAGVDDVPVLDFKAQYGTPGEDDRVATDPALYQAVIDAFPAAVFEDPLLDDAYRSIFDGHQAQISWDAQITGVESVRDLPFEPSWLNVKPARFGSVAALFDTIGYALERDIELYGGGMFEQDRGRAHLHALASLFYPDGPNDIAPPGYNEPKPHPAVPPTPLAAPAVPTGIGF
jgi:hypothetical protein